MASSVAVAGGKACIYTHVLHGQAVHTIIQSSHSPLLQECSWSSRELEFLHKGRISVAELNVQVGPASLNLLKGGEHLRMKRLLGEAFSEEAVVALLPELEACAHSFCHRWALSSQHNSLSSWS